MPVMTYFSEKLKAARIASGLKQDETAKLIGVSRTNYNDAENGRKPLADDRIEKLANLVQFKQLGLTYDIMIGWKTITEKPPGAIDEAFFQLHPDWLEKIKELGLDNLKQAVEEEVKARGLE